MAQDVPDNWRETLPVAVNVEYAVVTADKWSERQLTPPHRPIEIPSYLGPDWMPDWSAIPDKTPVDEIRDAVNEQTGAVMYKYVTTGYVLRTLDKVFRGHNWGYEIIREEATHTNTTNADYEYVVVLQIVAPGLFRPVVGVGSSNYRTSNKQDTDAKTRAGAFTAALKNAAKQLGIGRDLEEADPEFQKLLDSRYTTINATYNKLVTGPRAESAKEIIRKYAPTAILEDGTLMASQIEFTSLQPVAKDLLALATETARVKATASS